MKLPFLSCLVLLGACATCPVAATPTCPAAAAAPQAAPAPSEEVRASEAAPKRTSPSGKAFITLLARGQNAFVGKLEMLPGAAVPEHQDPTEEYIHVLAGHGTMIMNGKTYEIAPGTTIFMPAFATVSYQNGDQPMVAIQVFAGPSPADKYESWK
jgi:quercetin dioxygenase-like cupin family protein